MATVTAEQSIMRLTYREKVPVSTMKEIIQACLVERLTGTMYDGEKCNESAKVLSETIRGRLKNLGFQRYKFVVQVVIGERREQGIRYYSKSAFHKWILLPYALMICHEGTQLNSSKSYEARNIYET